MEQSGVQLIAQGASAFDADMKSATKAVTSFGTDTAKAATLVQDAAGRWRTATGKFAIDAEKAAAGVETISPAAKKAGDAADKAGNDAERGGRGFSAFGEIVTGALRKVGEIAVTELAKAAKATMAFVTDSIGVAGDFEAGMKRFQAVAGKGVDTKGLEQFKDLFIQLGKELPVSTSEVEQAAIEMVSGGIDPAIVAAGGLRQAIQFAAASGLSLADAAATSAKFLAGWTSSAATTEEKVAFLALSTDTLTKAAAASSTTAAELRLGLFNTQGAAQALHASFEDTTASLALLAPAFESSAQAGTALNVFMTRLVPQTNKAEDAMKALGLITKSGQNVFFDTQGSFLGMGNAAEQLKDKLSTLTDEQKINLLHELFGNDAMKIANLLMQDGAAGLEAMRAKMAEANGVSATAALIQEGYNTALNNAKGSVEAFQIRLGSFLIPTLTDLLNNYIAPGVNAVTDFAEAFFKMVPAIQASNDPIQTFLNALKVAAPGMLDFIVQIEDFKDGFVSFVDSAKPVTEFIGNNLTPILFGVGAAITASVLPAMVLATAAFIEVAAPIVALIAAGALLYKAWDSDFLGIKTTLTAVWNDTLLPAFQDMQAWLAEKIPPAIKTLADFWTSTLQPALASVWSFLKGNVFPILSDLADVYIAAAIVEVKALATLWTSTLQPALSAVWSFISGSVIPIFKALFEVNWAIATKAVEAMAGLWQKVLQPAFKSVGDYITATVVPAFKSVGDYLSSTFGPTLISAKKWLDDVTGGFAGVSGGVKDAIKWLSDLATSISTLKLPDWLTPGSPTPWETALYGIGKALQTSIAPGLNSMKAGIAEIGSAFTSGDLLNQMLGLGEDMMGGIGEGIAAGVKGVIKVINSTANTVEGAFNDAFGRASPAKRMIPIGEDISRGVMVGLEDMLPALIDVVNQTGTSMIAALTKNINKGGDDIRKMMDDLTADIKDIGGQINDAIADSFGATASIDRQMAKNFARMGDLGSEVLASYVEQSLAAEQKIAQSFADPAQGAKYFKMVSDNIFETAALKKKMDEATDQDEKDRLEAQWVLISRAQQAEMEQFKATQQGQTAPQDDIAAQIAALFQSNAVASALPGITQNAIVAQLNSLLDQLRNAAPQPQSGMVSPPASQGWQAGSTTNSSSRTYNMPIYTNNTPAALQQSLAVLQASTP